MTAVLATYLFLVPVAGLAGRRLRRRVVWVAAIAHVVALIFAVAVTAGVLGGEPVHAHLDWVGSLGISLTLRLDGLGLLFWWLISAIGLLVLAYSARYFSADRDLGRYAALMTLFSLAMLVLTAADNIYALFLGWELTSIASYGLIAIDHDRAEARASALRALLVTGLGGLILLAGLILLSQEAGTTSLAALTADLPGGAVAQSGLALVLLGAMTKSAQSPFHLWLPGAMAAPTPISAYLHSATMVKAGIYLLARFSLPAAAAFDWWTPTLAVVGSVTLLLGGYRALSQTDAKSLLAYGTVSQLGFMVLLIGIGDDKAMIAGLGLVVAHALFKAALFLTVGVVDHQTGTRDLRLLGGLRRTMPVTAVSMGLAAASMIGVAPLLGFISKESALKATLPFNGVVAGVIVLGAVLTTAYGVRLWWQIFATEPTRDLDPSEIAKPSFGFDAPAVLLATAGLLFGLWVLPVDDLVAAAGVAAGVAKPEHLALWHGFTLALGLSVTAIAAGVYLMARPDLLAPLRRVSSRVPDGERIYARSISGLNVVADRVTSIAQPGSLPVYAGVILITALVLPVGFLFQAAGLIDDVTLAPSGLYLVACVAVLVSAIGAARTIDRISAVLLLGGAGFGVAVLFVLQGAPDLALTQLLVETLALGLFVFVLWHLPRRFREPAWRFGNVFRAVVAAAVGGFVAVFALAASSGRAGQPSIDEYLARSLPDGGGRNVVNVILTDFRALDTLGEITVLAIAAIGITSMVRGTSLVRGRRNDEEEAA